MAKETINLPIAGGFNRQSETQMDSERTVNMYKVSSGRGKTPERLRRMPGILAAGTFSTAGATAGARATFVLRTPSTGVVITYAVVGNKFYSIDSANTIVTLGTLTTSTGHARIVANQLEPTPQVFIVDGVKGYIWDGASFTQITAVGFPSKPIDAAYLNGFFIVLQGESNKWQISGLNDGFTWDPLQFAEITARSDILVGVAVLGVRIFLFGTVSYETWYNEGRNAFPFKPDTNVAYDIGLAAISSLVSGEDRLYFLAATEEGVSAFMRITGSTAEPVSNQALNYEIHNYSNPDDCVSFLRKTAEGHLQYIANFTTDNHTWVYDEPSDEWYEREMLDKSRHIGQLHYYLGNKHYLIGYNDRTLYEENDSFLTNNGTPIRYLRRLPVFSDGAYRRIRIDRIKIDYQKSLGVLAPPYDKPVLIVRLSKDGGVRFGNDRRQELAPLGDYIKRTIFRRWGVGRDLVLELEHISKNNFSLFGMSVDYEVLSQ